MEPIGDLRFKDASTLTLVSEIWPDEGPEDEARREDRPEFILAQARAYVLVSRLLAMLADDRDHLVERSTHFAALAEGAIASAGETAL